MSTPRSRELHRVLKPGGTFHFAEHGRAPDPKVARTQDRFTGLQQRLAGGCHLERDIPALLAHAGFAITELDNSFLKGGPKAWSYMFIGRARRRRVDRERVKGSPVYSLVLEG